MLLAARTGGRRGARTAAATACLTAGIALLAYALPPQQPPPPVPPPSTGPVHTHPADAVVLPRSQPLRITAPAVGLSTRVEAVPLDRDGSISMPKDADHAGWFTQSVTPGERGNAIVVGHVDSTTGPAAFYGLGALRRGHRITVERRDGRDAAFTVTRMEVYTKNRFPDHVYQPSPGPQLTLITCTGWDDGANDYRANLVITAHPTTGQ
jgi:hypothetical protein